jgi:hypothetical protein
VNGGAIHILINEEHEPEVFLGIGREKEARVLKEDLIGARPADLCGDAQTISGAPSPSGGAHGFVRSMERKQDESSSR